MGETQEDALRECALRILEEKRTHTINTSWTYYRFGEALEEAFAECKANDKLWKDFLEEVDFSKRRAEEYRQFYRTYRKKVEADPKFFDGNVTAKLLKQLLSYSSDTRDNIINLAKLKMLSTRDAMRLAGAQESKRERTEKDSYLDNEDESEEGLSDMERKELNALRHAMWYLAGRKLSTVDTKEVIDAILDNQSRELEQLLDTPLRQFSGYTTIREYLVKRGTGGGEKEVVIPKHALISNVDAWDGAVH